ncbi:hypothetical protein PFISCL1PPCAC_28512, partial [Pristionchus fissidentatus]
RACASFFKRTKTTGRKYPCRQGDRKCDTGKKCKFVCRSCRYDRCLALGMEYEDIVKESSPPAASLLQRIKTELKQSMERRRLKELHLVKKCGSHKRIPNSAQKIYNMLRNH